MHVLESAHRYVETHVYVEHTLLEMKAGARLYFLGK
jgi:hypothetical protein